ncbi:MAG: AraC family transcriptional regulator [Cyanothece sp. SIO1E1]|nr:AraC family transcriptional regulator [Cyanothece sp. SIO1E1]
MWNQIHQQLSLQKDVLVERKAYFSSKNIELHFYETIAPAQRVPIEFSSPVVALMLQGEKILEMESLGRFEYRPGESLIVPAETKINIDFPSASEENPVQCLAFVPESTLVEEALYDFYEQTSELADHTNEQVDFSTDLLLRDQRILQTVKYLLFLFQENNEHRDLFINMTTKELVIRILQSKARRRFLSHFQRGENAMNHIARYIRQNLYSPISVMELSKQANMSKSKFFNLFKDSFGMTPNEFIIREKIEEAKKIILRYPKKSITAVAYDLGYSDTSYFCKQFKHLIGSSPNTFRKNNQTEQ